MQGEVGVRQPRQEALALGLLFLSGGILGVIGLLLPHWTDLNRQLMLIPAIAGLVGGSAMIAAAPRVPGWVCHPVLATGTLLVSFGVAYSGSPAASATYALFYVWVVVYAAYFFTLWAALVHLVIVGVAFTAALTVSSPDPIAAQVAIVVGILLVTGAIVSWLVGKLERYYRRLYEGERAVVRRLGEAEEVKDELVAMVSHELRTPLSAILGYTRTLQLHDERLSAQDRRAFLERIGVQSDRMVRMVENLLLASGATSADKEASAAVADVAAEVVGELETPGVHFELDIEGAAVAAIGPPALHKILVNLFDNGAKFAVPETSVRVSCRAAGGDVTITVANRAAVVPHDDLEQVFDPFLQLPPGPERRPEGMGLGLYVVRRLAEAHGGQAWADRDDEEIRVSVRLPQAGTQSSDPAPSAQRQEA